MNKATYHAEQATRRTEQATCRREQATQHATSTRSSLRSPTYPPAVALARPSATAPSHRAGRSGLPRGGTRCAAVSRSLGLLRASRGSLSASSRSLGASRRSVCAAVRVARAEADGWEVDGSARTKAEGSVCTKTEDAQRRLDVVPFPFDIYAAPNSSTETRQAYGNTYTSSATRKTERHNQGRLGCQAEATKSRWRLLRATNR